MSDTESSVFDKAASLERATRSLRFDIGQIEARLRKAESAASERLKAINIVRAQRDGAFEACAEKDEELAKQDEKIKSLESTLAYSKNDRDYAWECSEDHRKGKRAFETAFTVVFVIAMAEAMAIGHLVVKLWS